MPSGPKVFPPTEPLYRVLRPEWWDRNRREVKAVAFLDEGTGYKRLSVYFGSKATPRRVLEIFGKLGHIKEAFNNPTPEKLWSLGFGVAKLTLADVHASGLELEKEAGGAIKYKANGHVNIMQGQTAAADFALVARPLDRDEIFGIS